MESHNVGGHKAEVWEALRIPGNAVTITGDPQVVDPLFSSSRDDHVAGARIDTVLNEFSHSLERIARGKGNDGDGVPIIADAELSTLLFDRGLSSLRHRFSSLEIDNASGLSMKLKRWAQISRRTGSIPVKGS